MGLIKPLLLVVCCLLPKAPTWLMLEGEVWNPLLLMPLLLWPLPLLPLAEMKTVWPLWPAETRQQTKPLAGPPQLGGRTPSGPNWR